MEHEFDFSDEITNSWDILEKEGISEINKHPKFKKGDKCFLVGMYNNINDAGETLELAEFIEVQVLSQPIDEIGGWTYEISMNDTGITLSPQYNLHGTIAEAKEETVRRLTKKLDILSKSINFIKNL